MDEREISGRIAVKQKSYKKEAEKVRLLSGQYEQLQRAWSENAMLFHDMENHLQTIRHLAEEGHDEEICRYIARISRPVEKLLGVCWTGVGIVDAVLNAKKQLAAERGYEMDINAQLPVNTGIEDDDFCTVLTNLLDNAIESMDRESRDRKRGRQVQGGKARQRGQESGEGQRLPPIQVSLRHIHHFLVIHVSNPCTEEKAGRKGLFATAKGDRQRHGWGLKSVQRTLQKYNGSLSLEVTEGRFVASAIMFFN